LTSRLLGAVAVAAEGVKIVASGAVVPIYRSQNK